jgi:hypothetical protein
MDFVRGPGDGLILVGPISSVFSIRSQIITLTERYRLPAAYPTTLLASEGGLTSS